MKLLFVLLISVKICTSFNTFFNQKIEYKKNKTKEIKDALYNYLSETFPNFKINESSKYETCFNKSFEINVGLPNFLYFLSYSGRSFSDLGNEYSCDQQGFSYYLFSYNLFSKDKLEEHTKNMSSKKL